MRVFRTWQAGLAALSVGLFLVASDAAQAQSSKQMKKIVNKAEGISNDLDDDLPDAAKKTPLKGTADHKRLARQAEALEDTLDQVKKKFNRSAGFSVIRSHVEEAVRIAADIDPFVARYQFTRDVETDWQELRGHLNSMAAYFNVPGLDGGGIRRPHLPADPRVPSSAGGRQHGDAVHAPARSEMERIIARAEKLTDDLDDDLLGRRAPGPSPIEALEDTMDQIKRRFGRGSQSELRDLVNRALTLAEDINRDLPAFPQSSDVTSDWSQVRSDLNAMARFYNLPLLTERRF